MKRFVFPMVLLLGLVLLLAACAPASAQSQASSSASPSGAETSAVAPMPDATVGFTLQQAEEKFSEAHPDATISVAKQEGDVYYIEGWNGNILYKMKFSITNGEVLLDKTIETGRPT